MMTKFVLFLLFSIFVGAEGQFTGSSDRTQQGIVFGAYIL